MELLIEQIINNSVLSVFEKVISVVAAVALFALAHLCLPSTKEELKKNLHVPKVRWTVALATVSLLVIIAYMYMKGNHPDSICKSMLYISELIIITNVSILLINHWIILKRIAKIAGLKVSAIDRYRELTKIQSGKLTYSEKKRYDLQLYYLYVLMGNYPKAVDTICRYYDGDTPQFLMVKALKEEAGGDIPSACASMKTALGKCDSQKEKHLYTQLLNNCGRVYRIMGEIAESDKYYREAYKHVDIKTSEELRDAVFQNLFNTTSLKESFSDSELLMLLDRYESFLDMSDAEDAVKSFNAKLALYRIRPANFDKKTLIDDYHELRKKCKSLDQRINLDVSAFGVIIGFGADYSVVLKYLNLEKEEITKLKMPDRINAVLKIRAQYEIGGLYCASLRMESPDLLRFLDGYLETRAFGDVDKYYDGLPVEAILDRVAILRARAEVIRYTKGNLEKYISILDQIITIFDSNDLKLSAACAAIDAALVYHDRGVSADSKESLWSSRIINYLDRAKMMFNDIYPHPAYAGQFITLAWLYARIGDYKTAEQFIEKYKETKVQETSLDFHLQGQIWYVETAIKALRYDKAISMLKGDNEDLDRLSENAREFIKKYPEISTTEAVFLWAILMGAKIICVKSLLWFRDDEPSFCNQHGHEWLILRHKISSGDEITLELDMLHPYKDEGVFIFIPGTHPLELRTDARVDENVRMSQPSELNVDFDRVPKEVKEKLYQIADVLSTKV